MKLITLFDVDLNTLTELVNNYISSGKYNIINIVYASPSTCSDDNWTSTGWYAFLMEHH